MLRSKSARRLCCRVDTTFQVGDQVILQTKELLDAADVGKLRPRWEGPLSVAALAGPNTYTLALSRRFKCSPTVNVERLKPFHHMRANPTRPALFLTRGSTRRRLHGALRHFGPGNGPAGSPQQLRPPPWPTRRPPPTGTPPGWAVAGPGPAEAGSPVLGSAILYWWPDAS